VIAGGLSEDIEDFICDAKNSPPKFHLEINAAGN